MAFKRSQATAFTTEQIFEPEQLAAYILTIKANGGQVTVSIEHSPGVYVVADTFTADGAHAVRYDRCRFKITPTGGAEFNLI